MSVDLHLHTYYSDGTWSPRELVDAAVKLGLEYIAVTDHDTVDGIDETIAHANGRVRVIPGIELNTVWTTAEGRQKDVHILGYFFDFQSEAIAGVIRRQRAAREEQIEKSIEVLQDAGIDISLDEVHEVAGGGSIGRPHLAKALIRKGAVASVEKAYNMLMKQSSPVYVPRRSVGPDEAINAIKSAGGVCSLAHPGKDKELPQLLPELLECGLNGIEVYHRSHSTKLIKKYTKFAEANGLLITGGSDCHGPYEQYPPSIGTVKVPLEVVHKMQRYLAR